MRGLGVVGPYNCSRSIFHIPHVTHTIMQGSVQALGKRPSVFIGSPFLRAFRGISSRAQVLRGLIGHLLLLLSHGYMFLHIVHGVVIVKGGHSGQHKPD